MPRFIVRLVKTLLITLVIVGIVFVAGMRTKAAPVLNTVRRVSRATKPRVLKSAGTTGSPTSVVRHVGRTSGRAYATPVGVVPTDDGFVIALPYGPNTDWLKNVLAAGSATIVHDGAEHRVDTPEVVPLSDVAALFSSGNQRAFRVFGVEDGLRVRRVEEGDPASLGDQ